MQLCEDAGRLAHTINMCVMTSTVGRYDFGPA